jgi:hypothetical protein
VPPAPRPDQLVPYGPDDGPPLDDLDEDFFRAEVARIMADARRRAAGGEALPSWHSSGCRSAYD